MTISKKYVLQLCHNYATPFLDIARQYASLFDDSDYQIVTVYLTGKEDNDVIIQTASDHVIFLNNTSADLRGLKRKQIKQLKQLHAQYDFEFAIAHRYKPIFILSHIKDLPVIGVNHAYGVYHRFMRRYFVNRHKQNLYLLGVSNAIRDDIKQSLPHFPQQQIHTLYNRINIKQVISQQLPKFKAKKYLGLDKNKYVFASVGRLHPEKDHKTLISAFAKVSTHLPDTILVLLGTGKSEPELKHQVQQLHLEHRIFFLGNIPHAVNYFRAFDYFILSSKQESFGMVLLEAITSSLPVISSNSGGPQEVIHDPEWLFNVGDAKTLAELMLKVYTLNSSQKKLLVDSNMKWLQQNFTDETVKNAFWKLPFISSLS